MHTLRQPVSNPNWYDVGYYVGGVWHCVGAALSRDAALSLVSRLNGGPG